MTPAEVHAAIDPTGLPVDFETDCGPPPEARVVIQQPDPGGKLYFKEVRVWMDRTAICDKHTDTPCTASELKLDASGHQSYSPPHTGKTVEFRINTTSDSPCQLVSTASVTITGLEEAGQSIRGNPHWIEFDVKLTPNDGTYGQAEWAEPCSALGGPVVAAVDIAGLHDETKLHPSRCTKKSRVSKVY